MKQEMLILSLVLLIIMLPCASAYYAKTPSILPVVPVEQPIDCGPLSASVILDRDLISQGTCFTIIADNIVLDCNGYSITGDGTGNGVFIPHFNNITIKNCAINNFYSAILFNSSNYSTIFNNAFDLNKKSGIFLINSQYNNITKNTNTNTSGSCFYFGNLHCVYENISDESGIALCNGSNNNKIEDFTLYGNNTNTDIVECGVDAGIAIRDNSINNTIYNANLYYPDTYGILIWNQCHNTNISKLNVYGANSAGKSTNDAIIQGANIENLTFTHSYIENTSEWGPFLDASINAYIENLTVKNANKTGMRLTTNSTNLTIKDSYVNNSKTKGIYMEYSVNATITNNNVSFGCTEDGLYISGSNNVLINNTIYSTYENFHLENLFSSNLSDNIAYNSPLANGFFIRNSSNNNFTNNEVYNGNKGFYLDSSDSNAINNNLAYNNTDVGFRISLGSDNNNLTNNTAYNNSYHGLYIYFQSYNNAVINNTFYNNGLSGIYLQELSDNNALTDNTAYNNKEWDIYITNTHNNKIIGNKLLSDNGFFASLDGEQDFDLRNNLITGLNPIEIVALNNNTYHLVNNSYDKNIPELNKDTNCNSPEISREWYLNVNVRGQGQPLRDATVKILSMNGDVYEYRTDNNGNIPMIELPEYKRKVIWPDGCNNPSQILTEPLAMYSMTVSKQGYKAKTMQLWLDYNKNITVDLQNKLRAIAVAVD